MKKLILIAVLFITTLSYSQIVKMQSAGYKSLTTAQRDALTVPVNEHWMIYNSTTSQYEYWDGSVWTTTISGVTQLDNLSDVTSATPTNRFALMADGTNYLGRVIVEADISDLQNYVTALTEQDQVWLAEESNVPRLDADNTFIGTDNSFTSLRNNYLYLGSNANSQVGYMDIASGTGNLMQLVWDNVNDTFMYTGYKLALGQEIAEIDAVGSNSKSLVTKEWIEAQGYGTGSGGATNLTYSAGATSGVVLSDTGTNATIPLADGTNAGLITAAEKGLISSALQTEIDPNSWGRTGTTVVTNPTIQGDVTFFGTTTFDASKRSNIRLENSQEVGANKIGALGIPNNHAFEIGVYDIGEVGANGSAKLKLIGRSYNGGTIPRIDFMVDNATRATLNSSIFEMEKLQVNYNPTLGSHVGNRDYNDGRYGQLTANQSWSADNTFAGNVKITGNLETFYGNSISSNTTLTAFNIGKTTQIDSPSDVTITIPNGLAPSGQGMVTITLGQKGLGKIIIVAGSGVTIDSRSSTKTTLDQFSIIQLVRMGVDYWWLIGRLED